MAMTTCKECKAAISTKAEACPQCGAKRPKQTSGCAGIAALLIGVVFLVMIVRGCSDDSSPSTSATTSSSAANHAPAAQAKAPPPDPTQVLAEAEGTVSGIELKLQRNIDWMKKYYATNDQVNEATSDLVKLALIQGMYAKSTVKQEKSLSKHADSLGAHLSRQQRILYASSAEEIFIKNGMDIKVSALGKNNDQLRLKYVLMSKPLVYKFQNEMKLDEQARVFDFKKIIYTDGYESTWTEAL